MIKHNGFSLTELLVALVIMGILAIALAPNFSSYTLKANRTDAIKTLLYMQSAQEKYRQTHSTYASTLSELNNFPATSSDGYYGMSIQVGSATATTYILLATAIGTQVNDTGCTVLTLTYANNTTTTTPTACWQ